MDAELDAIASRLSAISEELADIAITRLREAVRAGATKAPADEKVITRARRSIEKAVHLIESVGGAASDDGDDDEG